MTDSFNTDGIMDDDARISKLEALREADKRFNEERDRRYSEVALEREKALKIKETADLAALQLAREIQTYKDEKANELRAQINSERGLYPTRTELAGEVEKLEAVIRPIANYVNAQQSGPRAITSTMLVTSMGVIGIGVAVVTALITQL